MMIKYAVVGIVCAVSAASALHVEIDPDSCGPANFLVSAQENSSFNQVQGGKSCTANGLSYRCCNMGVSCHANADISDLQSGHDTYYLYVSYPGSPVSNEIFVRPGQAMVSIGCVGVISNELNDFPCDPAHCQ